MKWISSLILASVLFVSCSGSLVQNAQGLVIYYDKQLVSDSSAAMKLWHTSSFKPGELEANIDVAKRKLGSEIASAKFEVMGSKVYKTWIFSGTIYKDTVEVDIKITIPPQTAQKGDLIAPQPVVLRQLTYVAEIDGQLLIVESQMSEVR
jgi:hypothetical protein